MGHILCSIFSKTLSIYLQYNMFVYFAQGSDLYLSPSPRGGELLLTVGSNLTLECSYSSSDIITKDLVITRDDMQLGPEFKESYSGMKDGLSKTLVVEKSNVTCSDGGTYLCTIDTLSKRINVTIVKVNAKDDTVSELNKQGSLSCRPEICSPINAWSSSDKYQFHVTWVFNGQEINLDDTVYQIGEEADKLLITRPVPDSFGIYTCKGDIQRNDGQLSEILQWMTKSYFKGPPSLRKVDPDKSVCLNDHVTLICEAAGFPPPVIEWRMNDSNVETNSTRIYVLSGGLYVQSFTVHDIGKYTCIAKSEEFSETDKASIYVKLKDASDCVGDSNKSPVIWISIAVSGFVLLLLIVIAIIGKKKCQSGRLKNSNAEHDYASINFKSKKHKKKKGHEPEALYDVVDVTSKKFETDLNDGNV